MDLTVAEKLALYREMCRIRAFEETAENLLSEARLDGNLHLSTGQEAIAVGVCSALRDDDAITTTHRGHGHCLAKGGSPERMFAELFGHRDGFSKGRAGSMHLADPDSTILGATAIVGGSFGMALGAAFSSQVLDRDTVSVAFFGEGAAGEGSFHEALNLAALWKLPVIFCCENNQYAELTHVDVHLSGKVEEVARAHGVAAQSIDGNDVLAVRAAATEAVTRAREGGGPSLLEALTYRHSGHYVGDPESYREKAEVEEWQARDPIERLARALEDEASDADALAEAAAEARAEIEAAAQRAAEGLPATVESIEEDVYAG